MSWRLHPDDVGEPIRITARMAQRVIWNRFEAFALDGPLAWAAAQDQGLGALPPGADPPDLALPLARWLCDVPGLGEVWGWCASDRASPWQQRGREHIRKRPAVGEMARLTAAPSVEIGAGAFKAYNVPVPTGWAGELVWYARGDRAEVERLLRRWVPAIGHKRAQGWGQVCREYAPDGWPEYAWRVEPWHEDRSVAWEGLAMRPMPLASGLAGLQIYAAVRPPYWATRTAMPAVMPEVDL